MASTMTPSAMTNDQIERAIEILRAQLRKHAAELPSDAVQKVFGQKKLGREWLAVLQRRVEEVSDIIFRWVEVDRSREPQAALDATGRIQYTDRNVVKNMPRGEGNKVLMGFFRVKSFTSPSDLAKKLKYYGLTPDPIALAALNEADPSFADENTNATQWLDEEGKLCYATFDRLGDERRLNVGHSGWSGDWLIGGVRE